MKNQSVRRDVRRLVPIFLAAALAAFWAATSVLATEAKLTLVSDRELEITGGTGKQAWRLRYGRQLQSGFKPQFALAEGDRAWFSHGGWLRLIDTAKGIVIGRWHFPGEIIRLTPQGGGVQIEVEEASEEMRFRRTFHFDPTAPEVPYWPNNSLMIYRLPRAEVETLFPASFSSTVPGVKISAEEAKKFLPDLEEAVRRDPLSPWFQITLGRALRDIGDPRAAAVFRRAVQVPTTDFTEMLAISIHLEKLNEPEIAREAFERAYADFWQRGNDPRLFTALLSRLFMVGQLPDTFLSPSTEHGRELIERNYRLTPGGEAADLAWESYARYLEKNGQAKQAQLWVARAQEARTTSGWMFLPQSTSLDLSILGALASLLSAVVFFVVTCLRYRPQLRLDVAAAKRAGGPARRFNVEVVYWRRRERFAFFVIVLAGWFSVGLATQHAQAILRAYSCPLSLGMGSLAGPVNTRYLENGVPASPERDLVLAVAYQQDGQSEKAERLYRSLPQFAESWNNLGVILKNAGKDQDARAAFEKALQLDPKLAEAALNLGRPPQTLWTELHEKYLAGRPMIVPPKGERFAGAFGGGSPARIYLRALLGPMSTGSFFETLSLIGKLAG